MRPTFNSKAQRSCRGQKHLYKAQMPTSTCRPSQAKSPWILSLSLILVALREVLKRSISFASSVPRTFERPLKLYRNATSDDLTDFRLHIKSKSATPIPGRRIICPELPHISAGPRGFCWRSGPSYTWHTVWSACRASS
jgi:hypothetical protein